ncbi:3-hydroxyacyl-ACP dehydratase [Vibrio tubiashii]|uniref:ApeI family dehydratase n=1 Tax=Vibrio tubiashii TaxID=29498 RepID=UPI001EFD2479|nr:3-hydroxyacyl-ACP dehydratase [Vibrio tubiashii]MCG9580174.1 3-hydroxyacyl-ACP dehydratase [Vibrio tubiashii]MCG9613765.1 3-hydroxyacyl-ACP dehydratase [Vibrio tubiashii]MCG9687276.1 3-hydroxyacyl-ACP dehydratase [Vibrio tubiashii]
MDKRKPTIIDVKTIDSETTLTFKVDADILDFRGHFTDFPLLPGVSQIDWALYYAVEQLNTPPTFKGMEVIKFQEPILPDMTVNLALNWDETKQKLAFKYSSQQDERLVIHSSGKMKLGQ